MDERSLVPRAVVRTGALARAGDAAVFASDEFFGARIRNPHTRLAGGGAVPRLGRGGRRGLGAGDAGDGGPVPGHAERRAGGEATGALGLPAVLRRPGPAPRDDPQSFASVTGERYQVIEGRTPEITISQARALLASLETSRPLGLRDRALFGTLCYTGARIGATLALQRGDLVDAMLRLREKGGKQRILPVRADTFGHGSSRRGRRVPARGHASQCPGLRHDTTRHAAEQGHADAQAASWYRKSAARGAAAAPVDLGISYNAGVGVPPNYGDAVAWYRRSADQGLASAQVDLGARDDRGEGRPTGVR